MATHTVGRRARMGTETFVAGRNEGEGGRLGVLLFLSSLFILPPFSLPEITRAPLVFSRIC
jgi:hypothetical protein